MAPETKGETNYQSHESLSLQRPLTGDAALARARRRDRRSGACLPRHRCRSEADFHDSHFHITNYIQEGTDIHDLRRDDGRHHRSLHRLRSAAAADLGVRQHRRFRADLLPAVRCPALLLLVHRRPHRHGLQVARAGAAAPLRPHDHRLQPRRHVRRRPHPAGAAHLPGGVLGDRRVHHPQGVRVGEGRRRGRQPHQPGPRPDLRLRR